MGEPTGLAKILPWNWWGKSNAEESEREVFINMLRAKTTFGGMEAVLTSLMNSVDGGPPDIFHKLNAGEMERMSCRMSVVFSCIKQIYTAAVEAKLILGIPGEGDEFERTASHSVLDLLNNPNPDMTYPDFLTHHLMHLLSSGVSFVWEIRNNGGQTQQLWPLPTSWVTPRFSGGKLTGWEVFQGHGKIVLVDPADMLVTGFPDPSHPGRYCGPLEAAMRDVQLDRERENYLAEMLANIKIPSMILKQPHPWTEPQKTEARLALEDRLGRGKRGGPLFLGGEGADVSIVTPLSDLDWPGMSTMTETRICSVYGVPPIVISLRAGLEHGTYSNFEQAERAFYRGTMPPLWRMLAASFTRDLLTKEGEEDLVLRYDTSGIHQLQEDANDRAERATKLFAGSIGTRNEARSIMGLEPLSRDLGDVILVPVGAMEVRLDGTVVNNMPLLPEPDTGEDGNTGHEDDDEDDEDDDKNTGHEDDEDDK